MGVAGEGDLDILKGWMIVGWVRWALGKMECCLVRKRMVGNMGNDSVEIWWVLCNVEST